MHGCGKTKLKENLPVVGILSVIGLTFGLLYVIDHLVISDVTTCSTVEGLERILECTYIMISQVSAIQRNLATNGTELPSINLCKVGQEFYRCGMNASICNKNIMKELQQYHEKYDISWTNCSYNMTRPF